MRTHISTASRAKCDLQDIGVTRPI
jgi:hypothetical protein